MRKCNCKSLRLSPHRLVGDCASQGLGEAELPPGVGTARQPRLPPLTTSKVQEGPPVPLPGCPLPRAAVPVPPHVPPRRGRWCWAPRGCADQQAEATAWPRTHVQSWARTAWGRPRSAALGPEQHARVQGSTGESVEHHVLPMLVWLASAQPEAAGATTALPTQPAGTPLFKPSVPVCSTTPLLVVTTVSSFLKLFHRGLNSVPALPTLGLLIARTKHLLGGEAAGPNEMQSLPLRSEIKRDVIHTSP